MHRLSTTLSLAALCGNLAAQPVLNAAQLFAPAPGTTYTMNTSAYREAEGTGANNTWDFSDLTIASTRTDVHEAPANGVAGSNFPEATIAISTGELRSRYLLSDATEGALELGQGTVAEWVVYTDAAVVMPPTVDYQDTWSDDFSGYTNNNFGEGCDVTGTIDGEADAYGTLVMPYGNVLDVMRLRITIQYTRSCTTGNSTTEETHDLYFDQTQAEPIVRATRIAVSVDGGPLQVQDAYTDWLYNSGAGMAQGRAGNAFTVFPNPAHGWTRINAAQAVRVELHDAQGRLVRNEPLANGSAILDLVGCAPSVYLACVTDRNGQRWQQRIVVE